MREIDKILNVIESSIQNNAFEKIETDRLELKDLSRGTEWVELYKTINAFLNSKGGIVVIGIKEDEKNQKFKFTDFNYHIEERLKDLPKEFTDEFGNKLDLKEYVNPNLIEIVPFLTGRVCLIFIEKLPEDKKYVFYKGNAYERRLTGDHKLTKDNIRLQNELRDELQNAVELQLVPSATIEDLDVDKLNEYILRLNTDKKVETIKADIDSAMSFLVRKRMIRDGCPTILGMLVCGKNVFDHLSGRCEVDAYFETGKELANDQKVYKDNIIPLMESAWSFAFSKIGTGVSTQKGGSTVYEYPEDVIRETINNALAHRDYSSGRFSILRVVSNRYLEIRNPGRFREEHMFHADIPLKIRKIIPIPKAKNPNLADILKVYKRWEGRGIGMSTLTNYALDNQIDVPYYRLYSDNEVGLYIPKGKVLDEKAEIWISSFQRYILKSTNGLELTDGEKTVLAYLYKSEELGNNEFYTINLTQDNNHFSVINKLLEYRLIEKVVHDNKIFQIYKINSILKRNEFSSEMRTLFGGAYDSLSALLKDVLQSIYVYNEFSLVNEVSANIVGNYLYHKKFRNDEFELKTYNNFKRNVRNYINKLEKEGFIVRKTEGKPNYKLNESFERKASLFDTP